MQRIRLKIHGGGRLEVHGSLANRRLVVILGRDNILADAVVIGRLIDFLQGKEFAVIRYVSGSEETRQLIGRVGRCGLPRSLQRCLMGLVVLSSPRLWRYISARRRVEETGIAYRAAAVRELVRHLGPGKEISFVARSAGAIVASLVADEVGARCVAALGYAFRHPRRPDDPRRYAHLANLRTPLCIIQGTQDSYGRKEILGRYPLARHVTIHWVDTDHDFSLPEATWERILGILLGFLEEHGIQPQPGAGAAGMAGQIGQEQRRDHQLIS